jgi:hypothetical protein
MSARQVFQNVLVRSPQELKTIPGYSPAIDLSDEKFVEVLSHYTFREEYQCALTSCHKWHKDGYVCVFESGAIGNVGNVCARKWIGSSFDEGLNRYQREIARPQLLSKLTIAKTAVPALLRQCVELRQAAQDFIPCKSGFRNNFPLIWNLLQAPQNGMEYQVVHSKNLVVTEKHEDGSEISRSKIVSERLGVIRGIRALRENVLILINGLDQDLDEILKSSVTQELSWNELNRLVNVSSVIERKLIDARGLVRDVQLFRTPETENLIRRLQGNPDLEKEACRFSFAIAEADDGSRLNSAKRVEGTHRPNRRERRRLAAMRPMLP